MAIAQFLAGFMISTTSPEIASPFLPRPGQPPLPNVKPAQTFYNFLSFVQKVAEGDKTWMLPDHEFKEWISAEDAWEAASTAYDMLKPESTQSMLDGIRSCGAPSQQGIFDDAVHYIRLLEQLKPLADQMHKTMNDLRNKDREVQEKWEKNREACREYQRCIGGDPATCG